VPDGLQGGLSSVRERRNVVESIGPHLCKQRKGGPTRFGVAQLPLASNLVVAHGELRPELDLPAVVPERLTVERAEDDPRTCLTGICHFFYIVSMQSRKNRAQQFHPLGEFETLVLLAILRLGDDAYGMRIHQEIQSRAGRNSSLGALYTTLDRLEQKGYVSSWVGDPTAERGGRAKKYFEIKAPGQLALRRSYEATRRMAKGLEPQLGGAL